MQEHFKLVPIVTPAKEVFKYLYQSQEVLGSFGTKSVYRKDV